MTFLLHKKSYQFIFCLVWALTSFRPFHCDAQIYYGLGSDDLFHLEFDVDGCGCEVNPITSTFQPVLAGSCYGPDDFLYNGGEVMYQIDPNTGALALYFNMPMPLIPNLSGLTYMGGGIYYTIREIAPHYLYSIDVNAGTVTNVGEISYDIDSDPTTFNGQIYATGPAGLILIDHINPQNSILITELSDPFTSRSLTPTHFCNQFLAMERIPGGGVALKLINALDGTVTPVCSTIYHVPWISSVFEQISPSPCESILSIDCEDGSNTSYFDCLSIDGVPVTGSDIRIFADDHLTTLTISIAPTIPDAPHEVLVMTGAPPNIDVIGSGTDMITLTNQGGASIQDFRDALQLIVYNNLSDSPTGGIRTIEVQFTTASGTMSDIATYFIDVSEIPLIPLDLGPDLEGCEGETVTLDAGNSGSIYEWSTGESSQTIMVDQSGQYMVTVSDGVNCPNQDTVIVDVLPNIDVALTGDTYICDNESATLIVQTDTPFALDIEIHADPGSSFVFNGVTDDFTFIDLPTEETTYTITSVTSSQPACITISDSVHTVEVFPSYIFEVDTSLCDGDSIWLGFFWETEAGTYENMLQTFDGCDSFVTTYITILPAIQIAIDSTTCSASEAGVFVTHLDNPNGCDTVVTTTVTLLELDTTFLYGTTCVSSQAGVSQNASTGSDGCDSIIITTTDYIPPGDTTFLFETTCDSSMISVLHDVAIGMDGCDSIIITSITYMAGDTTYLFETTCDSSMINEINHVAIDVNGCDSVTVITTTYMAGDTTYLYTTSCDSSDVGVINHGTTGVDGCDSTIITTITFSEQDSVFISETSCEPADVGTIVSQYVNQFGCDSIVTTTTSLLPSDTLYLASASCLPADTGILTAHYLNQFGCDSMVINTVSLLPSDQTFLNETTCQASQAGMFITSYLNQYGCDSIVTLTVELLEADTTQLFFETCESSEVGVVSFVESGSDGCDSIVIETTTLYSLPILDVQSAIDYNGFDISCTNEPDGSAIAIITGIEPYTYLWSTTEAVQQITGLNAGDYALTITDGNGCTASDVITLEEPTELMMGFEVTEPDCFDQALGIIRIDAVGGVPPYTYTKDGGASQISNEFHALSDGIYQFTVMDANGCTTAEIISIDVPLMVQVELGDNQVISLGDSALLNAIINLPFNSLSSILWTGIDSIDCPNCLTQIVAPIITTAYSVSVTSTDGCSDADSVTVAVTREQQLYIPNIFSPNGDGINDVLRISADAGVRELSVMEIYDRWGNLVFGFEHKTPDDPAAHWDGLFKGQALNPGVFTYRIVVVFVNGQSEVSYGDITLVK